MIFNSEYDFDFEKTQSSKGEGIKNRGKNKISVT